MKTISIKHYRTNQILFTAPCASIKKAVELAIANDISLAGADLRYANLINAQMDGAILDDAQLNNANLMGSNLSEASLQHTSLTNAQLHSTTLCYATLDNTDCRGALFGGTDITGTALTHCRFDTLSALDLNFRDARRLEANSFISANGYLCRFSQPPLSLKGLCLPLTFFDNTALVNHHALTELPMITASGMSSALFAFISGHRTLISALWENQDCGKFDILPDSSL